MQNNINLAAVNAGETVKIVRIDTDILPAKFYELGFLPGTLVKVTHKAPLHGPVCIHIIDTDSLIAIRQSEAEFIFAEQL